MIHQSVLGTQAHVHLQTPEMLTDPSPQLGLTPLNTSSMEKMPERNSSTPEADKFLDTSESKAQSAQTAGNTNSTDGYNWRKYGQKQVKRSDRSRSYYKCTNVDCSAKKKVERDPDGKETGVSYSGQHNHGLPKRNKFLENKEPQSGGPARSSGKNKSSDFCGGETNKSHRSTSKKRQLSGVETPEPPLYSSSDSEEDFAAEEYSDEPDLKRSILDQRTVKEPKVYVQSSCDMERINDGYRWRKYGQKNVKGNPNPRSYYRCTHNGCPVRKQVERASDDIRAILITYEGKHNHPPPEPEKKTDSNEPDTAALIAAAVASVNQGEESYSSSSSDDDRVIPPIKSKKVLESAQTQPSMGLNSPSKERGSANKNPALINKNHPSVPVRNL